MINARGCVCALRVYMLVRDRGNSGTRSDKTVFGSRREGKGTRFKLQGRSLKCMHPGRVGENLVCVWCVCVCHGMKPRVSPSQLMAAVTLLCIPDSFRPPLLCLSYILVSWQVLLSHLTWNLARISKREVGFYAEKIISGTINREG